jgi:hypothetical protein
MISAQEIQFRTEEILHMKVVDAITYLESYGLGLLMHEKGYEMYALEQNTQQDEKDIYQQLKGLE